VRPSLCWIGSVIGTPSMKTSLEKPWAPLIVPQRVYDDLLRQNTMAQFMERWRAVDLRLMRFLWRDKVVNKATI
jgi:hypothetical protein